MVMDPSPSQRNAKGTLLTVLIVVAGLMPVAPVLAWVYRLGSFQSWYLITAMPALVTLLGLRAVYRCRPGSERVRTVLAAGVLGGIAGTIGYDLIRIPYELIGLRPFAPIDSYGVLIAGADSSRPLTGMLGWAFHFTNGIGFGIAFAAVALGRRWWWGIVWGFILETATVVTPFASDYQLKGKWGVIALAYLAHVAYGVPLGRIVEKAKQWKPPLPRAGMAIAALIVGLLIWHRPFSVPADVRRGIAVAPGPSALVRKGRFVPEWMRTSPGGCVVIENTDDARYTIQAADGSPVLAARSKGRICFSHPGVLRVKTTRAFHSGGFVIVDPFA